MEVKKGFKQTEIGTIPEDWDVKPLGEITHTTAGGTPSTLVASYWGGNIQWMNSGELHLKRVFEVEGRITEAGLRNSSANIVPPKCVLIGLAGQGKTRGTVAMNMIELCTNQSIAAIFPSVSFAPEYLFFNLDNRYEELREISSGDGGRGGLNLTLINRLEIPLPPLPEQTAIAEALSDADALIEALEQLLAKKRQVKQGAMQELLTGKRRLPGFENKLGYKKTEVGMIPEDWKVSTLGELCSFENGDRGRNYPSRTSYASDGVPFINAGHVEDGHIQVNELNYIPKDRFDLLRSGKVLPGDILFCLRGSLGKFGIVGSNFGEGAIASSLVIVRPKSARISREYLNWYFKSSYCAQMIDKWSGGAAQPNLGVQDLVRFTIPIPPTKDELTAIATILSDMDAEIAALEAKLAKARQVKQGMMQELLTGRIRLI